MDSETNNCDLINNRKLNWLRLINEIKDKDIARIKKYHRILKSITNTG
jgi:hypothetical protein